MSEINVGDRVEVFDDSILKDNSQGHATVQEVMEVDSYIAPTGKLYHLMVEFEDDPGATHGVSVFEHE